MPDDPNSRSPSAESSGVLIRKLSTILSADVAEFSRLMGEDEEATLKTFRGHKKVFEALVATHRGRIFNTAGDAILAEFASAVEAVRCATDIQSALRTRNDQLPPNRQVRFRIGINLGDVMVQGEDLMGDGVNVAARLQTAAEPGGICLSGSVHDQILNKLSLSFVSLGEMNFKNIQQPIRTFSISESEDRVRFPSPKPRPAPDAATGGGSGKWIAAAVAIVLVVGGGAYWFHTTHEGSAAGPSPTMAPVSLQAATTPETAPSAAAPEAKAAEAPVATAAAATAAASAQTPLAAQPKMEKADEPRQAAAEVASQENAKAAIAAAPAVTAQPYDGNYAGRICFAATADLSKRCFNDEGTISAGKISSQWTGREQKISMDVEGSVSSSGDVKVRIRQHNDAEDTRLGSFDLTGTIHDGIIDATGSSKRGRDATLNWHKTSAASR